MSLKDDAIAEMFDLAARLEVHAQWLGFVRMDQASRDMIMAADHIRYLAETGEVQQISDRFHATKTFSGDKKC